MNYTDRRAGFTIVELLIVIVVIGILAAITIVAYNGIQTRAKDSSVQTMLNNVSKKATIYKTVTGQYPTLEDFQHNRAPGSTVNNSGPAEARLDGAYSIGSLQATPENGTSYVRYVYQSSCDGANLDWYDYKNGRYTSLSTNPKSIRLGC